MTLRTKIALAMTTFMLVVLIVSFGVTGFVARQEIVDARYDILTQALNLLEEDVRNQDAVLTLHEDSVVLQREANGAWVITGGEPQADVQFPVNFGEPTLVDDWFVVATTDGLAFAFKDAAVSDTLRTLTTVLLVAFLFAVLMTFIGTWWILRSGLSPLRDLDYAMRRITDSGKLETIQVHGEKDEVATLSTGFNQMINRVEGTMAQQRRFVADVSHELKTPLTVIEGYAKLLQRWGQADASVRDEAIAHILSEARQMREDLIEPMLELNRFAALEHVETEDVDLAELGEQLTERFRHSHDTPLSVTATGTVRANRESLQRILVIFIDNSLKYATDTTVELTETECRVCDHGPVIPDEVRARLFDRFYRLDEARDRSGSGLGLSIAQEVADVNGWEIGSRANVSTGSIFYLRF